MKYKSFIVVVLAAWPLLLFADSKKEQQEQMQLIIQLLQMEEATKTDTRLPVSIVRMLSIIQKNNTVRIRRVPMPSFATPNGFLITCFFLTKS